MSEERSPTLAEMLVIFAAVALVGAGYWFSVEHPPRRGEYAGAVPVPTLQATPTPALVVPTAAPAPTVVIVYEGSTTVQVNQEVTVNLNVCAGYCP